MNDELIYIDIEINRWILCEGCKGKKLINRLTLSTKIPSFSPPDWVSQAEAARIRKVSKQAIAKLVQKGRLRHIKVGGHLLVLKRDAQEFQPKPAGRPRGANQKNA